jgi:di/tricarboxylate transporter
MLLAERYALDKRIIGICVLHGAASGNFSPLNPLGALALHGADAPGLRLSGSTLLTVNFAYNVMLCLTLLWMSRAVRSTQSPDVECVDVPVKPASPRRDQIATYLVLAAVALCGIGFRMNIGAVALGGALLLHALFPSSAKDSEKRIAWNVVLLVCGVITFVGCMQENGTIALAGDMFAHSMSPPLAVLLIFVTAAVTSAFASSVAVLGAAIPLAAPLIAHGNLEATAVLVPLAICATVVDSSPFSTAGALVVAGTEEPRRPQIYSALVRWGAAMTVSAPLVGWMLFRLL